MTADESHRQRARRTIKAAKLGFLPKPNSSSIIQPIGSSSLTETTNQLTASSPNTPQDSLHRLETGQEKSIEVYEDKFSRNSILTRSARVRKFKFYQYKPIEDSPGTPRTTATTQSTSGLPTNTSKLNLNFTRAASSQQLPKSPLLSPREDVLEGKVALVIEQESEELVELEEQIEELDKKIADLNNNINHKTHTNTNTNTNTCNVNEIFQLVNRKNDLLRRQMQLNILEQEKVLEKANDELVKELRSLMSIEDDNKTQVELERQQYLYDKYLALVDRRNELVLHLDVQEKGIEDDQALKKRLKEVLTSSTDSKQKGMRRQMNMATDQNCCIQ